MNKNITFFLLLSFFNIALSAENKTKTCSFEYVVSPKDAHDLHDFNDATQKLLKLFDDIHRNPENNTTFYDNLLGFIQELQQAVIAGLNLFSSSSTSTNNEIATVNEVAQTSEEVVTTVEAVEAAQAAQANITEVTQATTTQASAVAATQVNTVATTQANVTEAAATNTAEVAPTKTAQVTEENAPQAPKIKIATTISCDDSEKEASFEELKSKMTVLAEAVNDQTCTAEQLVTMLNTIIQESKESELAGNISINIQG